MEITALGDSALLLHVTDSFEAAPNEALDEVLGYSDFLRRAQMPGLRRRRVLVQMDTRRARTGRARRRQRLEHVRVRDALEVMRLEHPHWQPGQVRDPFELGIDAERRENPLVLNAIRSMV